MDRVYRLAGQDVAAVHLSIGFADYIRIGLPVTLATLAVGTAWLWIGAR
ncbi:MAG TPA: hypothetical protein VFT24_02640 [Vicinamibacterales bacterium]|nr:hypothetical protein [Vicinamibacterales bacterium]